MMRRPSRRGGRGPTTPPLLPLAALLLVLLSSSFCFLKAAQAREQQHSVVRLRSLEVGPAKRLGHSSSSSKRLFPFPRLLLEGEGAAALSVVPAPPLPDPRDERWGPLSSGAQAIVSFGGKKSPSDAASEPFSSSPFFSSSALSLSPSAAAVAAVERVGGVVSDSLPDDALLAVGLTEEALDELEKDQGTPFFFFGFFSFDRKRSKRRKKEKTASLSPLSCSCPTLAFPHTAVSWLSTYEPEMKVAPEWQPLFEAGREMLAAEAEAAAKQGEELLGADDAATAAATNATSSASPLSRVPPAAAPFVYLSSSSDGGNEDELLIPTIDLVVSFPALLPKHPGAGGGGGGEDGLGSYAPAAAAAEGWKASLDEICSRATLFSPSSSASNTTMPPARCSFVGSGRDRLVVSVPLLAALLDTAAAAAPSSSPPSSNDTSSPQSQPQPPLLLAEALVKPWAARSAASHWVSPRARPRSRNAVAAGLAQSGLVPPGLLPTPTTATASASAAALLASSLPGAFPLWEAGIRGQGQILGMGDTGLDYDHCLFVDPALQPPLSSSPSTTTGTTTAPLRQLPFAFAERDGTRFFASATHRKLAYYRALSGDAVDGSGHGTHCAGTAVGSSASLGNLAEGSAGGAFPASRRFEGMAPAARLAFTDIGAGSGGDLSVPVDLVADYFPYHYNR